MKENKLVVASAQWASTIPQWVLEEVKNERLILGMESMINPNIEKVGDAEVAVYLYTLSLQHPVGSTLTNVYVYVTSKLMKKRGTKLLDFMKEQLKKGLTDYEEGELKSLRGNIYTRRGGEISHPILEVMRHFNKKTRRNNNDN